MTKRKSIRDNQKMERSPEQIRRLRNKVENIAAFGLILICAALALPFLSAFSPLWMGIGKWVFTAGTVIFLVAKLVRIDDKSESVRLKRLRRMEAWAGFAFAAACFFWFWNEAHHGPYAGSLAVLRDTIMFALAGAMIQIVASWLIVWRVKKENKTKADS